MREKLFNVDLLVRVQQITWYVVIVYFALVFGLMIINVANLSFLVSCGVILILAATGVKLIIMAEQFRIAGLTRFWLMSYTLILVLLAVAAERYFG